MSKRTLFRAFILLFFFVLSSSGLAEIKVPVDVKKYGFPGKSDWWLQIGWDLELDYKDAEDPVAGASGEAKHSFSIGNGDLKPAFYLGPDIFFQAKFEFSVDNTILDEATFNFKNLPWSSYVSYGMDDPFAKPDREVEAYKLATTAFFRDDDYRLELGGKLFNSSLFYWKASVSNGLELSTLEPGEYAAFPMLHDDDQDADGNNNKEIGLGLGMNHPFSSRFKFDLLGFWYYGRLSEVDEATLESITRFGQTANAKNYRAGVRLDMLLWDRIILRDFFVYARDAQLTHWANDVEIAYNFTWKGWNWGKYKIFSTIQPVYVFGYYDIDTAPTAANSLTWDRSLHVFGLNLEFVKTVNLRLAYSLHQEHHVQEVANNDFLAQLKWKF